MADSKKAIEDGYAVAAEALRRYSELLVSVKAWSAAREVDSLIGQFRGPQETMPHKYPELIYG